MVFASDDVGDRFVEPFCECNSLGRLDEPEKICPLDDVGVFCNFRLLLSPMTSIGAKIRFNSFGLAVECPVDDIGDIPCALHSPPPC